MDFRSLYRSHPTEFAKQSKQSHHLVFMKSNVWSLTQRRQDIDHLFLTQCFQFYLKFRIVYRCMHPPCLNFILCSSSFADVINAVLYPMLQPIYHFLEKTDKSISKKISCLPTYPPYNLLPRVKKSSKRLRTQTSLLPCVNPELFKASFINRLYFKYTFTF